ncbi:FAD-binding oxidoreductase [Jiangella alkaliphila]|uniref:FAD/FMN-containing dehydrogenase n=1 Tax=Jiangella alkaliphila TaxID=419479 RepID=A0A1H2L029_9ACTN|nr:FAD-binding oxidoreductase [Jiangella alkaliphila]SDU73941.1 FAD/FMN-containing dehydrogenase [Jiangella alkaliphila]
MSGETVRGLRPGDAGYDAARTVWNAMVDRRPALIARCATAAEVVEAVRYGREQGLEIGVRGGGHSVLGLPIADGGLVIDLAPMGTVRVDAGSRRARVGGGALLGALDTAAQRYGLTTTAGNVSHTGVGGLTLGGGVGWLARMHGLTCDNVTSYEVVTADGELVTASRTERPDLFWGLRGGGGNFGVVTEFEFRLHPIGTRALRVELVHELEDAGTALRGWRDLLAEAPRRATPVARVTERDGRPVVTIGYVWVGDPADGRRLLAAYRSIGRPVAERVEELSYLDLQTADDDDEGHAVRRYWKGHYLRQLSDRAIEAFLDRGNGTAPAGRLTLNGGAVSDVPDEDSAFSHRDALVEFTTATGWTDPAEDEARMSAAREYAAGIEPFASGAYVNALSDEGASGVRRAYTPAKLARLTELKVRYDPDNVFHLNPNIRPEPRRAGDGRPGDH